MGLTTEVTATMTEDEKQQLLSNLRAAQVCVLRNDDFILTNVDFLLNNDDFLLKNDDVSRRSSRRPRRRRSGGARAPSSARPTRRNAAG